MLPSLVTSVGGGEEVGVAVVRLVSHIVHVQTSLQQGLDPATPVMVTISGQYHGAPH